MCCVFRSKYDEGKYRSESIDAWDPAVIPRAHVRSSPSDLEMVDRTSKQNLLDQDEPQVTMAFPTCYDNVQLTLSSNVIVSSMHVSRSVY